MKVTITNVATIAINHTNYAMWLQAQIIMAGKCLGKVIISTTQEQELYKLMRLHVCMLTYMA